MTAEPLPPDLPDQYVAARVHQALTEDDRVHEQGIDVAVVGDALVLSGTVPSDERREAVELVAREVAPGFTVRNAVAVADLSEPETMERI